MSDLFKRALVFFGCLVLTVADAQDDKPGDTPKKDSIAAQKLSGDQPGEREKKGDVSPASSNTVVKVTDAYWEGHEDPSDKKRNAAGFNDLLVVKVNNLKMLIDRSKCVGKDGNCTEKAIVLYLDGREIKGIMPESGAPDLPEELLRFRLQRTTDSNDRIWADLLGAPPIGKRFFHRPTSVSVGLENDYPVSTDVKGSKSFQFIRIRQGWFWSCSVAVLFLLYFIGRLARESNLLRDSGTTDQDELPARTSAARKLEPLKPYSLARCQMAFWFFLVVTSFLYLWLITGAYDIITVEALTLIGIGSGTALGAAVIDVSKRGEVATQLDTSLAEQATLTDEIADLTAQMSAAPPGNTAVNQQTLTDKQTRLHFIQQQIQKLSKSNKPTSTAGLYRDVLTDETGISFHRFQIVVWTAVLGILFIYSVWSRLSMPEFGATLLALQGISAGTYLGFKIPEKPA